MKKIWSVLLTLCLLLALSVPALAESETPEFDTSELAPITIKFGFSSSQKLTDAAHGMLADRIEELSNGKITVERYLQGQVYTDDATGAIMVSDGTMDMIVMGDMMVLNAAPEIAGWTQVPFIFRDSEHAAAFWAKVEDTVNEKMKDVYNCYVLWDALEMRGARCTVANRPILTASDYEGVKFRLPSMAATVAAFEALGVSALTSSWSEVYQIMQTGIADAAESPLSNFESISIYEVAKYVMETNHTYAFRALHVNLDFWNGLDPVYQEIIRQAAKEAFAWFSEQEKAGGEEILKLFEEKGMTVYRNDSIDVQSIYEKASKAILEKYSDTWDLDYYNLIQGL